MLRFCEAEQTASRCLLLGVGAARTGQRQLQFVFPLQYSRQHHHLDAEWRRVAAVFPRFGAERFSDRVAEDGGELVGFASMEGECLDMLYVRADRLREGIASALCDALEDGAAFVTVYASLTARPFFEKRGYATVRKNTALRRDIPLTKFLMRLDN